MKKGYLDSLEIPEEKKQRVYNLLEEAIPLLDKYLPELRKHWEDKGENFDYRVFMTLFMKLIHAGFFNIKK